MSDRFNKINPWTGKLKKDYQYEWQNNLDDLMRNTAAVPYTPESDEDREASIRTAMSYNHSLNNDNNYVKQALNDARSLRSRANFTTKTDENNPVNSALTKSQQLRSAGQEQLEKNLSSPTIKTGGYGDWKSYREYMSEQRNNNEIANTLLTPMDWINYNLYEKNNTNTATNMLQRTLTKAGNTIGGEGAMKTSNGRELQAKDVGTVGNFIADTAGTIAGTALMTNNGQSFLKTADNAGIHAGKYVGSKISNPIASRYVNAAVRGAVDNGMNSTILEAAKPNSDYKDVAKAGLAGSVGGALFSVGGQGVSDAVKGIGNGIRNIRSLNEIADNMGRKDVDIPQYTETQTPTAKVEVPTETSTKVETPTTENNLSDNAINNVTKRNRVNAEDIKNPYYEGVRPSYKVDATEAKTNVPSTKADINGYDRDIINVGNRSVKSMQYNHSELKPYIHDEAETLMGELERTGKGGHYTLRDDNGIIIGGGKVERTTSTDIGNFIDSLKSNTKQGSQYEQAKKAIQDVIDDNGKENNANAKRVELLIDDRLSKGYTDDMEGIYVPKNADYIKAKANVYGADVTNNSTIPRTLNVENAETTNTTLIKTLAQRANESVSEVSDDIQSKIEARTAQYNKEIASVDDLDDSLFSEADKAEIRKEYADSFNKDIEAIKNGADNTPIVKTSSLDAAPENSTETPSNTSKASTETPIKTSNQTTYKGFTREGPDNPIELKESKMKTNTYTNDLSMQDADVQKVVNDLDATYEVKHNKDTVINGMKMAYDDFDGTVARIKQNGIRNADDMAAASVIKQKYIDEGKATGDYSKLNDWLKFTQEEATNLGQTVQAIRTWKTYDSSSMVTRANKIIDGAVNKIKTENPKLWNKVQDAIKGGMSQEEAFDKYNIPRLTNDDLKNIVTTMDKVTSEGGDISKAAGEITKDILNKIPPTWQEKAKAIRNINLLFNVKTQVRNFGGNVTIGTLENVKDVPGTWIDKVYSKFTGNARTTNYPQLETQAKTFGSTLWNSIKHFNDSSNYSGGRYEVNEVPAFKIIENPKNAAEVVNNFVAKSEDLTKKVMEIGDKPFYQAAFENSLQGQLKANNLTEPTEEMVKIAVNDAENRTFQNASKIVDGFSSVRKGLNKILGTQSYGLGDVAIPYVKTPANILDKAVDYSPAGLAKGIVNTIYANSKGTLTAETQKKIVDQLSRGLVGSSLILTGYEMAKNGLLNGKTEGNDKQDKVDQDAGKTPYSIKVGNKYATIDWVQPSAIPLMIGADIAEEGKSKNDALGIVGSAIITGGATLFNQSLLQGMADLFSGYSSEPGENIMTGAKKTLLNVPSQFVPFNSLLNQVRNTVDDTKRSTSGSNDLESLSNRIKNRIPGLSSSLPEQTTAFGDTKTVSGDSNALGQSLAARVYNAWINPGKKTTYNPSTAERIASDVYSNTKDSSILPTTSTKQSITYRPSGSKKDEKYTFTDKNEAISYQTRLNKAIKEKYNEVGNAKGYEELSYDERLEKLKKAMSEAQKEVNKEFLKERNITVK